MQHWTYGVTVCAMREVNIDTAVTSEWRCKMYVQRLSWQTPDAAGQYDPAPVQLPAAHTVNCCWFLPTVSASSLSTGYTQSMYVDFNVTSSQESCHGSGKEKASRWQLFQVGSVLSLGNRKVIWQPVDRATYLTMLLLHNKTIITLH